MNSELQRLFDTMSSTSDDNSDLRRELSASQDATQASAALQRHGYDISPDDIRAHVSANADISDKQLDSVSAGYGSYWDPRGFGTGWL